MGIANETKIEIKTMTTTKRSNTILLDRGVIIDLLRKRGFDVPSDAKIFVQAPSGGDCSGEYLYVARDIPGLTVFWETTTND